MVHVTFQFAPEVVERDFDSTFDAYCKIIDTYNQHEDYFVGAKIDNSYVKILDAESYIDRFVKYLHTAVLAGFPDSQILEETKEGFGESCSKIPASWRKLMKQYSKALSRYTDKVADEVHIKLNQNK